MKCSGFSLPLWCTVLSGAMALGPMGSRGACASDYDPNASTTTEWSEDCDPAPSHHYYPVEDDSNPVTSRPAATSEASTTGYHGYHYEYPESDFSYPGEQPAGHEGDSAAYSFKYGYRYASPTDLYGEEASHESYGADQGNSSEQDAAQLSTAEAVASPQKTETTTDEAQDDSDYYSYDYDAKTDTSEAVAASTTEDARDTEPAQDDSNDDRYDCFDEPFCSDGSKQGSEDQETVQDTANIQPDSQPRDYSPWADEYDDDFSEETSAPKPQSVSSSSTGSVTPVEQPAEPETLADYAKWVEVYGYSTGDTWLFSGLYDDNAWQSAASSTPSVEADSTCSRDAYVPRNYGYADYGYADFGYVKDTYAPKSPNCVEIWNKYRYDHYYPQATASVGSTPSQPASPAEPRGTEQVSSQDACEFEYRFAQESTAAAAAVARAVPQSHDADYYYADPYAYYGYDYGYGKRHYQWQADPPIAPAAHRASGVELFGLSPAALLTSTDQDLLRELERSAEEPSGVRRAALNAHLESLDYQAIDFVTSFEDATGIEVLSLADDPLSTATLLGTYRLLERGELGRDEAADLLRRSLQNLSADWAKGVRLITANAYETGEVVRSVEPTPATSADARSVTGVLVTVTLKSLWRAGETIWGLPQRLAKYDWQAFLGGWEDNQAANKGMGSEWFQR